MRTYAQGASPSLSSTFSLAIFLCLLAALLGGQPRFAHAGVAGETNDLLTMEYQQVGACEEEAVRLACIRAVNATIGRMMFSDYKLQAMDLLDPYIQKNYQKFVASTYVLERRAGPEGFGVRIRVQTFPEVVSRDLQEKRFLIMATGNPYFYVFLQDTVGGQASPAEAARKAVIEAILREGGKVYQSGVQSPPNNMNVMTSHAAFSAAREGAQRVGAQIIISGAVDTRMVDAKDVLYDKMHTCEAVLRLEAVRAADGVRLAAIQSAERASDKDPNVAVANAVASAVGGNAATLFAQAKEAWRLSAMNDAQFEVMFTNLTPQEVETMKAYLDAKLTHGTRSTLRSYYGNVAILGVHTSRQYAALERSLLDFTALNLRLTDRLGKRVTVEVAP